jgi:ABC-2 type transport system permease protein
MSSAPTSTAPVNSATGRFRGVRDLELVGRQVFYEQLAFWLNPVGAAFTLMFSVVFLVLLGATAGNTRVAFLGNIRAVQYYVPTFACYGVMAACFNMLSIQLVIRREMGLLKRLRLSPMPTWVMLGGIVGNAMLVTIVQVVALLVIGRFGYHVAFPQHLAAFVFVVIVGVVCFTALGIAASTLVPNQEAAGPMISIVFFVLLFLAGLWYPIPNNSGLAKFSSYLPVRNLILAANRSFGHVAPGSSAWAWGYIKWMALWGVIGIIVSLRRWRWEPRPSRAGRT